jgi:hypothetical protein
MRLYYSRVKLTHSTRDMHRFDSARAQTVDVQASDPNRRGGGDALVIFRDDAVLPGEVVVVHKKSGKHSTFAFARVIGASLHLAPSLEDVEVADKFLGSLPSPGYVAASTEPVKKPQSGTQPSGGSDGKTPNAAGATRKS